MPSWKASQKLSYPTYLTPYLLHKIVEFRPKLDARRPTANDDNMQQALGFSFVNARLNGQLEVTQDAVTDAARVPHFLRGTKYT